MTITRNATGLIFADDFNRADGLPGANWVVESGVWIISNKRLKCGSVGETVIRLDVMAARADMHVQHESMRDNTVSFISALLRRQGTSWYLMDIGGNADGTDPNSARLYRNTAGYTRLAGGPSRNMALPKFWNRINASVIGNDQRIWIDGAIQAKATDATVANQAAGKVAFDFFQNGGTNGYIRNVIVCASRTVTMSGLPAGYKIQVGDSVISGASDGVTALSVDIRGSQMPCVAQVMDATGAVIDALSGIYGGDDLTYVASAVISNVPPTQIVTGLLFADNFNRADGAVANGWQLNSAAVAANGTPVISGNELHFYGGGDGTTVLAPPQAAELVSQFKYDHGSTGGEGGWHSGYDLSTEDGYLFYLASGALELYRRAGGTYPRDVTIARAHPAGTVFHYKAQTAPGLQRLWSGPNDPVDPGKEWINNRNSVLLGAGGRAGPRNGPTPTIPGTKWDDVVIYRNNRVRVAGLPDGYTIAIAGKTSISVSGEAVINLGSTFCPAVLLIFNAGGLPLRAIPNVYGGDEFEWAAPPSEALPAVSGVKTLDFNPSTFLLGARQDRTPLTSGNMNSGAAHVNAIPWFHSRAFPTGRGSVRSDILGANGFSVPRPVDSDFTVYLAVIIFEASSTGLNWFNCSTLADTEASGSVNDFGLNVRLDGHLIVGTGAPDVSTVGTAIINDGQPHTIAMQRVRSTGQIRVWVDDVLDITHNGSTAVLSAGALMYFGMGASVGRTTTDYGRVAAWTTAHTDAERLLVTNKLRSLYIAPPPDKPTATLTRLTDTSVRIDGSAYVGLRPQQAAQWQLTRALDVTFATPLLDSGTDLVHLASRTVLGVPTDADVIARVRYLSDFGDWSDWSDTTAVLPAPVIIESAVTVFPYEPDASESITETIIYKTDVIVSHSDKEQRLALRRRPTIKIKFRVTLTDTGEVGRFAGTLWKKINNIWYVPFWPRARTAVVVGSEYMIDPVDFNGNFSGKVLVWQDSSNCDLMDFVSQVGSVLTLSGDTSFDHTVGKVYVIPVGVGAIVPPSWDVTRFAHAGTAVFEFEINTTGTTSEVPLEPAQLFRDVEVLTLHPDSTDGTSSERWVLSSERSGGELGPFLYRPYNVSPIVGRGAYWVLSNRTERNAFRRWLATRRGKKNPLWVSTYQDDFKLVVGGVAGTNFLDVENSRFGQTFFGLDARAHLALHLPDGSLVPVTVTSADNEVDGIQRLHLEDLLGVDVPTSSRVSFLVYARLTEDVMAIEHVNSDIAIVTAGFTELPRETPA